MDMFGVAAPFVDGCAFFAIHAGAPLLEALRFGGAVAFVSRLALRFGGLLAGGWRAEHLHWRDRFAPACRCRRRSSRRYRPAVQPGACRRAARSAPPPASPDPGS